MVKHAGPILEQLVGRKGSPSRSRICSKILERHTFRDCALLNYFRQIFCVRTLRNSIGVICAVLEPTESIKFICGIDVTSLNQDIVYFLL